MKKIPFVLFLFSLFFAYSQESLKSAEEEYFDFLSLQGIAERPTVNYRTLSDSEWKIIDEKTSEEEKTSHLWENLNLGKKRILWESGRKIENFFFNGIKQDIRLKIYGPEWFNSVNTHTPYGQNDGVLWQGRGYNSKFSGGVRLEAYGFEVTIKPEVSFSQNMNFEMLKSGYENEYGYFWGYGTSNGIDLPQRFGSKPFFDFSFGDSEVRWSWHTFTVGFGTQSPWLGPAVLNPMLGSNNASPYPKFDIGLRKTKIVIPRLGWHLGSVEARVWTGLLEESKYFDSDKTNDKRMVNAISVSYSPPFIPGLSLGANRIFLTYWRPENFKQVFRLFYQDFHNTLASSGNDEDQKISFFADWKFSKIGLEIYGEFGRDDFSIDEISNPFHTAIYTVGLKQRIPLDFKKNPKIKGPFQGLDSEILFEWNNFEISQDFQLQWNYMGYYAHHFVKQGYTNKGQILGAGSGYFGNSQYLSYVIYHKKGSFSLLFHRFCPDNNYINNKSINLDMSKPESGKVNAKYYSNFETYLVYGIGGKYFFTDSFSVDLKLNFMNIFNYNIKRNNKFYNFYASMSLKYNF